MKCQVYLACIFVTLFSCQKEEFLLSEKGKQVNKMNLREIQDEGWYSTHFKYCEQFPGPVGGGFGYPSMVKIPTGSNFLPVSSSDQQIKNAIENAPLYSVIYLDDLLDIDLTNVAPINIPEGVTVASGRGRTQSTAGALLRNSGYNGPLFQMNGNSVRITGLRLFGGHETTDASAATERTAIFTKGFDKLEVDNCEIYGWPYAGIWIGNYQVSGQDSWDNLIHNNLIYNNRAQGLGYGVTVVHGFAIMRSNIFQTNRHDIASSGYGDNGYEASCNNVLGGGEQSNFDVHAAPHEKSNCGPDAGKFYWIHHNKFFQAQADIKNVEVFGRPRTQCRVENNIFEHALISEAVTQTRIGADCTDNTDYHYGNMIVVNNIYNDKYLGTYLSATWDNSRNDNVIHIAEGADDNLYWYNIGSYAHPWKMLDYTFGDFNGDGATDIYKHDNTSSSGPFPGYYIPFNISSSTTGFVTNWNLLHSTNYFLYQIKFGEFDGDMKTDAFLPDGANWYLSSGSNTGWTVINSNNTYTMPDISFGRYNTDAQLDVFIGDGVEFKRSNSGVASWDVIATSGYTTPSLFTEGDFDGNGYSDVFIADGTEFLVGFNRTGASLSSWYAIATSTYLMTDLRFGDFNRDNKTDVMVKQGSDWYIALSTSPALGSDPTINPTPSTAWKLLATSDFSRYQLPWGDLK